MTNIKSVTHLECDLKADLKLLQSDKKSVINFKGWPYNGEILDIAISYEDNSFKLLYTFRNELDISLRSKEKTAENIAGVIEILKEDEILE